MILRWIYYLLWFGLFGFLSDVWMWGYNYFLSPIHTDGGLFCYETIHDD